jgi:tetratricopeptide (TPR) repeat protein
LDGNAAVASDDQLADFLVPFTRLLHVKAQMNFAIEVIERYLPRIDRLGNDQRVVFIRANYVNLLCLNTRYRDAVAAQRQVYLRSKELGDVKSRAYGFLGELWISILIAPKSLEEFLALKKAAIQTASEANDSWIIKWTWWAVGWEELHRGLVTHARQSARELMRVGQLTGDIESTGIGLWLLTWISIVSDSYTEALEYSEQALAVAVTPMDRELANGGKGCALMLLRRTAEAQTLLVGLRDRCAANGYFQLLRAVDAFLGVNTVIQGRIASGIRMIEDAISRCENEGYRRLADWHRLSLAEVYLTVLGGNEKLPLLVLLKNLPVLVKMKIVGSKSVRALASSILNNPFFDPAGHHIGRAEMVLGMLCKTNRRQVPANKHLTKASRILAQFGHTPTLRRIEMALAELEKN